MSAKHNKLFQEVILLNDKTDKVYQKLLVYAHDMKNIFRYVALNVANKSGGAVEQTYFFDENVIFPYYLSKMINTTQYFYETVDSTPFELESFRMFIESLTKNVDYIVF